MKRTCLRLGFSMLAILFRAAASDGSGVPWPATDGMGRALPIQAEVGAPRQDRFVAVFYFLWLGQSGDAGPFDNTKILAANPAALTQPDSPLWGPLFAPHHWGEPLFGYYVSDDDAVLAKHAQMLDDAGVDVVIFDASNQLTYPQSWQALCRVWEGIRQRGGHTPQIAFLCPFGNPKKVVTELYRDLYAPGLYSDRWFRWEGKPLILADPGLKRDTLRGKESNRSTKLLSSQPLAQVNTNDTAIRNFFTFRKPQPDYFAGPQVPNEWGWLEVFPQHAFTNAAGTVEEVAVGVAQNAVDGKLSVMSNPRSHGRSFHQGREPGRGQQDFTGQNFSEQWNRAIALDPKLIFVTGWNEWFAGRYAHPSAFYGDGPLTFVDEFNREFSRDCEPMLGGHGDAFYWQLVANIRRFKGVPAIPSVRSQPIVIDGKFDDWVSITPEFRDDVGDPVQRDHTGWGKDSRYVNKTGRNDIVAAKVSAEARNIYFYVRTQAALTPPTDPNWMLLFIDADQNAKTGWLGYDFAVRRYNPQTNKATLERQTGDGYHWGSPVEVDYRVAGNELELAVPRAALGIPPEQSAFDFKWVDNILQTGDWSDFTVNGDAAPNDRYNFRAIISKPPNE